LFSMPRAMLKRFESPESPELDWACWAAPE
jgi:hypothetical protein